MKFQKNKPSCKKVMAEKRPYLLDVRLEKPFDGKDSDWFDHFSVSQGTLRQS